MDVPAVKPVPSVATSPNGQGRIFSSQVQSGKDLPPPPPPPARLDPVVMQNLSEKQAALARQMSHFLNSNERALEFQVDAESGRAVVTVRDGSGNVVRTIPAETAFERLRNVTVESGTFVDSMA
jgi:hypothetical protein